jgi:hypothetical protein
VPAGSVRVEAVIFGTALRRPEVERRLVAGLGGACHATVMRYGAYTTHTDVTGERTRGLG